MKVSFRCRKAKKTKDGLVPIEVSICSKCERRIISTGRKIDPFTFSAKFQKVKGNDEVNEFISAIRSRLYSIETSLINNGLSVTVDAIINAYHNGDIEKSITFSRLFDIHNDSVKKKVRSKLVSKVTLQKYEVTKGYVMSFFKEELKRDDVLVRDITPNVIENLFSYLFVVSNAKVYQIII